jgi:hypothetical protein
LESAPLGILGRRDVLPASELRDFSAMRESKIWGKGFVDVLIANRNFVFAAAP